MKIGIIFLKVFLSFLILCACTGKDKKDISKADWLIGTWGNKTDRGIIYETWSKTNDTEFAGKSYVVKELDTIVFENIRLVQEQDGLIYIPQVDSQNDGLPVRFTGKAISETQLIFENSQHDFPQIISYTEISTDSLVAVITGAKNGQKRRSVFPMKKLK